MWSRWIGRHIPLTIQALTQRVKLPALQPSSPDSQTCGASCVSRRSRSGRWRCAIDVKFYQRAGVGNVLCGLGYAIVARADTAGGNRKGRSGRNGQCPQWPRYGHCRHSEPNRRYEQPVRMRGTRPSRWLSVSLASNMSMLRHLLTQINRQD